mmetsp:Transcript_27072/g.81999  ORF Transcript_27072/g.81999 Transcript_27072/m.81999 type:complete len:472 (+) Transcript_27072:27-1442(+)|eukprot:scaffold22972_cov43-Tisochrysis_lutea.AAC.1
MASASSQQDEHAIDAEHEVRRLFGMCFPVELLQPENETRLAACHEHVKSRAFQLAPVVARRCSSLLQRHSGAHTQDSLAALDAALDALYVECDLRANAPAATSVPSAAARLLQRSLFMCAVLLLHAALSPAPTGTLHKHAEPALRCLCQISGGVVAVPELDVLERRLLLNLAETGKLAEVLLDLLGDAPTRRLARSTPEQPAQGAMLSVNVDSSPTLEGISPSIKGHLLAAGCAVPHSSHGSNMGSRPRIPRSSPLALRWAAASLTMPEAARALEPSLPQLLIRTSEIAPSAAATASVLRACLRRLQVDKQEEREAACRLIRGLLHAAAELMRVEADHAEEASVAWERKGHEGEWNLQQTKQHNRSMEDCETSTPRGHMCSTPLESRAAAALCSLVFELLHCIADPLLPALQQGVLALAWGAPVEWQRTRCFSQLREAVCASTNHSRKPSLIRWLLETRARESLRLPQSRL